MRFLTGAPFLLPVFFLVGGIVFARGYFLVLPLFFCVFILTRKKDRGVILPLVFLLGIFVWGKGATNYEQADLHSFPEETQLIRGQVKEKDGDRFLLGDVEVKTASGWMEAEGKYWMWVRSKEGLKSGDFIKSKGTFRPLEPPSNPGQPDWRMQDLAVGVWGRIFLETHSLEVNGHKGLPLQTAREFLQQRMEKVLGEERGALLAALLLGRRSAIDVDTRDFFYSGGLGHILAVSGLHMGFIALIVWVGVEQLPLPGRGRTVLFCLGIVLYMALAGWRTSVIRAGVMVLGFRVGKELERGDNPINFLSLAAFFLLLYSPFHLWTPGFQLSFLITFFIIMGKKFLLKIRGKLMQGIYISSIATLAAFPLTAYHFQTINPLNFLANIWALPLTGVIVMSGFCGFIPLVGEILWRLVTLPAITVLERALEIWAGFPGTSLSVSPPPLMGILFFYLVLTLVLFWLEPTKIPLWQNYKNRVTIRLLPLLALLLAATIVFSRLGEDKTRITFLDVGQGDAVHIYIPEVGNLMVDAGGERGPEGDWIGERIILPYLRAMGIRELEAIFISHFHEDHYRGFLGVLENKKIGPVYGPPLHEVWQEEEFFQKLKCGKEGYTPLKRGDRFKLAQGVKIDVLHPGPELIHASALNNNSIVLNLVIGEWSFLLTGDIEAEAERELIQEEILPRAEILKVAHHGSSTSTSTSFLERVRPLTAVIQVGHNHFGHPDPEVIANLERAGVRVFSTLEHGAVIFSIDRDGNLQVKSWGEKYCELFPLRELMEEIKNSLTGNFYR